MRSQHPYRNFKSEESHARMNTHHRHTTTLDPAIAQTEKKFFDIQYIFEDPTVVKRRRYNVEEKPRTSRNGDKKYKTIEPQCDLSASVIMKIDDNLLKMQPVQDKQLFHMQKTDLSFNKESKRDSIHARRLTLNSSLFKSLSVRRSDRPTTSQQKPFEGLLSSKNYSICRETRSSERQKRRAKVERQIRKLQTGDINEMSKGAKKALKIESDEFLKYCEKNIEFAKNAFILRHKQTIRIYRPWSPINLDEDFAEYEFGRPA